MARAKKTNQVIKRPNEMMAPKKLKLLVTIVDRRKVDFYLSILEGYEVNFQQVIYALGTAPSNIESLFGLNRERAVILSVVKEERIKRIMSQYEDKYFKTRNGKGIAFTIPLTSTIGVMVYRYLANIESE